MTGDGKLIMKVVQDFKKEQDAIETQMIDLCYNMNGGVTWDNAWHIPAYLREKMVKYINKKVQHSSGKEYL